MARVISFKKYDIRRHYDTVLPHAVQRDELAKARESLKPKDEQITKQAQRINDLKGTLHSVERQRKQISDEHVRLVRL